MNKNKEKNTQNFFSSEYGKNYNNHFFYEINIFY